MNIERKHVLIGILLAGAFSAGIAISRFSTWWSGNAGETQIRPSGASAEQLKGEIEALVLTLSRDRSAVFDKLETFKTELLSGARRKQNEIDRQIASENSRWAQISDLMNVGAEGFLAQEEHREKVRSLEIERLDQEKLALTGGNAGFLSVPEVPSCSLSAQSCYGLLAKYNKGLRDLRASYEELGSQILGGDPGFRDALAEYDRFLDSAEGTASKAYKLEADLCRSRSLTGSICADLGSPPEQHRVRDGLPTTSVTATSASAKKGAHASPSFNCRRAVNEDEKIICSDDGLASQDRRVAELYRRARELSSDRALVLQEQRQFLMSRGHCRSTECLANAYDERIARLESQM